MFTSGFALGEVLEGVAQSLPEGLRTRFADNGIRGLFGRPYQAGQFRDSVTLLTDMVRATMRTRRDRDIPFSDALDRLEEHAGDDETQSRAVRVLREANEGGVFDGVPFETVWTLMQAIATPSD